MRERDYSNIKAKVWREQTGLLYCELSTLDDRFILMMVSANKGEDEAGLVQTALNCLSHKDLAMAGRKVA